MFAYFTHYRGYNSSLRYVKQITNILILCFVDRASFYNLVNKTNLVHNLFLVYLSVSRCFGRLWAQHQEKQLCLCDIWYLLFCVDDCLVCRVEFQVTSDA